jgi:Bacterial SH3 domain
MKINTLSPWSLLFSLVVFSLITAGCTASPAILTPVLTGADEPLAEPVLNPTSIQAVERTIAVTATQTATLEPTLTVELASTPEVTQPVTSSVPASLSTWLYQDDFTNPTTGWTEAKFDNYFIGYHEPEYYHIEVDSPNDKATAFMPEKQTYGDVSVEVKVQTNSRKTAESGDFIYGPIIRRSGEQYYAMAISPRSKQWFLLKSSPSALVILAEGSEPSIHDMDADDTLRIDAQGSTFFLHINDHLVAQVSDTTYASGEVGFYVQTFDSTQAHIHFDELKIWNFEEPRLCKVLVQGSGLNLRIGPGMEFNALSSLSYSDVVQPIGYSTDGNWLKIRVQDTNEEGWIIFSSQYESCNFDATLLPVIIP